MLSPRLNLGKDHMGILIEMGYLHKPVGLTTKLTHSHHHCK